jgi:hypothetical protein
MVENERMAIIVIAILSWILWLIYDDKNNDNNKTTLI